MTDKPNIVTNKRFRRRVMELLVELGNASGLGLKITGAENVVMVVPRAGRSFHTIDDLLRVKWFEVHDPDRDENWIFQPLTEETAREFLEELREEVVAAQPA